jgi:peptide deformylase
MILPIVAYGDSILREKCKNIEDSYSDLDILIANMWQTMYKSEGIGLAAPQIGSPIRLFVIDTKQMAERKKPAKFTGIKKVFINAEIIEEVGEEWKYEEGCLSIPGIREEILRKPNLKITYLDENFEQHTEEFDGINARVIQHEYDHIEGILFIDHLKSLKKKLLQPKLQKIAKGQVDIDYKMKFPLKK